VTAATAVAAPGAPGATAATWADEQSPEWHAVRRTGIGASDLPAIAGASQWGTQMSVVLNKRGQLPPRIDEIEQAWWGRAMEPLIADRWADLNRTIVYRLPMLRSRATEWALCSPDRGVTTCPDRDGPCALQIKTRSPYTRRSWRSDVPDDVLVQVHWEMRVGGWGHSHVAALLDRQLITYRVDWDQDVADWCMTLAAETWGHVQAGTLPDVDPDNQTVDLLNALFPDRTGIAVVDPAVAARLVAGYRRAGQVEAAAKTRKDGYKARLITALGSSQAAAVDDISTPFVTYKTAETRPRMTTEAAARLAKTDPDTYAELVASGHLTAPAATPTLRLTKTADDLITEGTTR
jgi:putative phage-type endonuclease